VVIEAFDRVHLDGTGIDRITEDEVVAVVRDALSNGRGGRIITPNVDILRRAASDPSARRHLDNADLIVADGMPLIWASRLGGAPPSRLAQISGIPSATIRSALSRWRRADGSVAARRRMSTFGVMMRPPRPADRASRTTATTSSSVIRSIPVPSRCTRSKASITT
jgi:hypothetical protein